MAGSLFNGGHGIEDHVLAEAACYKLNAGRQIFDEVYRHNTGRQRSFAEENDFSRRSSLENDDGA